MDDRSRICQGQLHGYNDWEYGTSVPSFDSPVPRSFVHSSQRRGGATENDDPRSIISLATHQAPINTAYDIPTVLGSYEHTSASTISGATRCRPSNTRSRSVIVANNTTKQSCAYEIGQNQRDHQRFRDPIATRRDTLKRPSPRTENDTIESPMDPSDVERHALPCSPKCPNVQEAKACGSDMKSFLVKHQADFARVSCTISCVATSLRPLHRSALEFAVAHNMAANNSDNGKESLITPIIEVDTAPESILQEENHGDITFRNPAMRGYLHHFVIDDIDASHATIASICQSVLDEELKRHESDSPMAPGQAEFITYAHKYKELHEKEANLKRESLVPESVMPESDTTTPPGAEKTKGSTERANQLGL